MKSLRTGRPEFTCNGLNPMALRIALFLHGAHGIVRMETIRDVAAAEGMQAMLPAALEQLQEYGIAEVCTFCDTLLTVVCNGQWCAMHQGDQVKTGHLGNCPRGKKRAMAITSAKRKQVSA